MTAEHEAEVAAILAHEMGHELAGHFCLDESQAEPRLNEFALGSLVISVVPRREREADALSLRLLDAAGYDPHAALVTAKRLAHESRIFGHREHATRVDALRALLRKGSSGGRSDGADFLEAKDALRQLNATPRRSTRPAPSSLPYQTPDS